LRRFSSALALAALVCVALLALPLLSGAANLPGNCTKVKGSVTCTTFEGPGNNQAGVGTTTTTDTQGNTSNFSPAPQGTGTSSSCKPPKSQGTPCNG
jgi:hypothetical protein